MFYDVVLMGQANLSCGVTPPSLMVNYILDSPKTCSPPRRALVKNSNSSCDMCFRDMGLLSLTFKIVCDNSLKKLSLTIFLGRLEWRGLLIPVKRYHHCIIILAPKLR